MRARVLFILLNELRSIVSLFRMITVKTSPSQNAPTSKHYFTIIKIKTWSIKRKHLKSRSHED